MEVDLEVEVEVKRRDLLSFEKNVLFLFYTWSIIILMYVRVVGPTSQKGLEMQSKGYDRDS